MHFFDLFVLKASFVKDYQGFYFKDCEVSWFLMHQILILDFLRIRLNVIQVLKRLQLSEC
jgi:hypothetical protein